ncbi:glycosyltransferase [Sediminibacterium sp.]|uniref:glycosyltransferase n=1 Tax=Sediminibacterium sp. TaxID=1917865 RepID=UPI0027357114|nr:glycosyltransferase [Sediminibacterium sp.]MDP3392873.1 glycosyltransferase [Sediminibacterium sp.]MDP3565995.1 glycosyltransferase [Sediminibacterium sp.]
MLTGRDIIIVGQQPWDVEIGSNCKNIALEFSKHNRVLYVNSALDRVSLIKGSTDPKIVKRNNIIKHKESGLVQINPSMWNLYPDTIIESINWIKIHTVFKYLNRINNERFAKSILNAIQTLGFSDYILFNDNDMFRSFHLKELLKPKLTVYYSRDYMLAVDYWKRHGEKLEPKLIADSDICVANSTYLADYCREYNPHSYYVGQGCELDLFMKYTSTELPIDVQQIKGLKIGYVGALSGLRLDIELLVEIAKAKPNWSILLVGPEDEMFLKSQLHELSNVYFLGSKSPSLLPEYIHSFDICLNPQVVSQVTIGNYPRKIDEYLAMGKPVVATSTPFMEAVFSGHTYLAKTAREYIDLIAKAHKENTNDLENARKDFASTHTWENSVAEIYKAIQKHL